MNFTKHRKVYLLIILTALLTGCGGPLRYVYTPSESISSVKDEKGLSIYIAPVTDRRGVVKNVKKIGELDSTVINMYGKELVLSEEPALIVRKAIIAEFTRGGFTVAEHSANEDIEYILNTELRKFNLDIAATDKIDITLYMEVRGTGSKTKIWSGIAEISDSRYAGVSGDSRRSIKKYISTTLEKVIKQALGKSEDAIRESMSGQKSYSNTSIQREESAGDKNDISRGLLNIKTQPSRAKIYLNGVYYGLSPQRLELKPGIYDLKITKEGFLEFSEKIAIDKARETEIEENLSKDR